MNYTNVPAATSTCRRFIDFRKSAEQNRVLTRIEFGLSSSNFYQLCFTTTKICSTRSLARLGKSPRLSAFFENNLGKVKLEKVEDEIKENVRPLWMIEDPSGCNELERILVGLRGNMADTDPQFKRLLLPAEETPFEQLLRIGLYIGAVFQVVCLLAIVVYQAGPSDGIAALKDDPSDVECSENSPQVTPRRPHRPRKQEKKKRR